MIQSPNTESSPVRPSRASSSAAVPVRPAAVARTEAQPAADTQSRALAYAQQADPNAPSTNANAPKAGEARRANLRAHVTRRLGALQSMDASMQAALMRINQMRQLAMRAARSRPDDEGRGEGDTTTLSSVFEQLDKDIALLVEGQLGGYLAATASDRGGEDDGQDGEVRPADDAAVAAPRQRKQQQRQASGRGNRKESGGRPSQRVQLQVSGGGAAEVGAGSLSVEGDLGSSDGASALLADLELLARQITTARATIQNAVGRLQRDPAEGEPAPIRTLGTRRRQPAPTQDASNAALEAKSRKGRAEDPISVVRARLALAIAAQANTSPEAAMRLI